MNVFAHMRPYEDSMVVRGDGDWFHLAGFLLFLLVIGLSVAILWRATSRTASPDKEDPLEVARLRLAKGEIDTAQYEQLKKALK